MLVFWIFIVLPGIPFILVDFGYGIYVFLARGVSAVTQTAINPTVTQIAVSAHGAKDNADGWSDDLQYHVLFAP